MVVKVVRLTGQAGDYWLTKSNTPTSQPRSHTIRKQLTWSRHIQKENIKSEMAMRGPLTGYLQSIAGW